MIVTRTRGLLGGLIVVLAALPVGAIAAQLPPGGSEPRQVQIKGPLLTAEDQAAVRRICNYRDDEWDGVKIQIKAGAIACNNGAAPDSAELREITVRIMARLRTAG